MTVLRRSTRIAALAGLFVTELVVSALRVAVLALTPKIKLRPAIVAYPLTVTSDPEITLLANLITLTPGTLSVDVSADRRTLFIHAIDVADREVLISAIAGGFETKVLEVFR